MEQDAVTGGPNPRSPRPVPPSAEAGTPTATSQSSPRSHRHMWPMLLAGLAAGIISGAGVARFGQSFMTPPYQGMSPPPGWSAEMRANSYRNAGLSAGIVGLSAGSLLGLTVGWRRRSAARVAVGVMAGGVLGAAFGATGGFAGMAVHLWLQGAGADQIHVALAVHSTIFVLTGFGVGLGVGIAAGYPLRHILPIAGAAAAAGIAAGLAYPVVAFVAFPTSDPSWPVPERPGSILLWTTLSAVFIGVAIGDRRPSR